MTRICSLIILITGISFQNLAQNTSDTRLMHSPAISKDNIAFIYAEDLWIANKDGSNPRRITIDEGVETDPVFSPDGSMIAFSAEYDGNRDVFIVPVTGGVPKRLTWHPSWDITLGFTPDGKEVLFSSPRTTFTRRYAKLYSVKISGGQPKELPIPTGFKGTYSSDGKYLAYVPNREVFNQWKHYRGGTLGRIWIMDLSTNEVTEIPKPEGNSNEADPEWIGSKVYFRSDRAGEFNLYSYDVNTKEIQQHTNNTDFGVLSLNGNGNDLIYEYSGYLYKHDPATGSNSKITVGIATDLLELRSRYVSGSRYIRSVSVSPSAARVALDFRGEIVTIPEKNGDVVNHTQSPDVHEKYPAWSPDGKHIAYFSDESGEYALHIKTIADGNIKKINLTGAGFYAYTHWSPDNKKIAFVDNGRSLYVTDVSSGATTKIASDDLYYPGVFRELFGSWSKDSKWISYTIITETNFEQAFAYSIDQKTSFALSDGLSNVTEPIFDASGKYLYMLASTDAGPVVNWFDQSNLDMEMSNSIYLITLQKDQVSPLVKRNDLEMGDKKKEDEEKKDEEGPITIDWDGIFNRIIDLPISPGMYSNLASPEEGKIYYISRKPRSGFFEPQSLMMYDMNERKEKEIMAANGFEIASNGKKMLFRKGNSLGIAKVGSGPENGMLNVGAIKIKIDPTQEWNNIFHEAWKVNRDYFYDPGMHGVDWDAMKSKYSVFLSDISCRSDLYRVMQWMCSELAVGHHRFGGRGDRMNNPDRIGGGLLGADYVIKNGRYQISKIYGGLNWNPGLRSPLTEPGVNASVGDYLIAVDGNQVTADRNLYSFFENMSGKIVKLTLSRNSDGSNARKVNVVPVGYEGALRNRDWVEGNIKKVDEATNGQVAYVYVPNTTTAGHEYFKRYFFPQVNKKAVIIDERFNGGGQLADYYIDHLKKPYQSSWNFRYGKDLHAPSGSIQGPKVMLIDENAGSGGDYLPYLFKRFGLGKLIGKRTWGGLVGVLGYPEFIDGGSVTAPNVAYYNEDGFRIENEGVAPDIEVEQWPKEVMQGKDPQLEKAIEVILEELKNNAPSYPQRPDYPVRNKE
ncbi:PDZ domain-containing protein [Fulvivirgaceae bacterium BMA10]|uniref:Tricorn protease homolog n=1 Tax=Splendidivirga corallicola TaxID=3051826 RepID=A0ABT8KXK1_9BACT|nr:PDZ domain-containing protein [Fulvivirgaceae bacterium BMA10]